MSANWCCHCGYMLPFGRKNSVKCSECSITCHQTCSHLVPDFCGMTMEMANILLKNLRDIKTTQVHKKPITSATSSVSTLPLYQGPPSQQGQTLDRPVQPQQSQALPPQQQQAPPRPAPPPGAYSPADNRYAAPGAQQPTQPQYPQQPYGQEPGGQRPGPGGGRPMPQPPVNQHRLSYEKPRPQEPQSQVCAHDLV